MKKIKFLWVLIMILFCGCSISSIKDGEGSEKTPYLIYTTDQLFDLSGRILQNASFSQGKYFQLMNDLDFQHKTFYPIGRNTTHPFDGVFDGNGHCIKNIVISSNDWYEGIFGTIGNHAIIKNLTVENIRISTNRKNCVAGGIVGFASYGSKVVNCHVRGIIFLTMKQKQMYSNRLNDTLQTIAGGIAGETLGDVFDCTANVTIQADAAGGIVGRYGGFYFLRNQCLDSYIHGSLASGGLIGIYFNLSLGLSVIANCFVDQVQIVGNYASGGAIGATAGYVRIQNSIFNTSIALHPLTTFFIGGIVGIMDVYWSDVIDPTNFVGNNVFIRNVLNYSNMVIDNQNIADKSYVGYFVAGRNGKDYAYDSVFSGSIQVNQNENLIVRKGYSNENVWIYVNEKDNLEATFEMMIEELNGQMIADILRIPYEWLMVNDSGYYQLKTVNQLLKNLPGEGSKENPYQIDSIEAFFLIFLIDEKTHHFVLTKDIDAGYKGNLDFNYWYQGGCNFVLDGKGHTIYNFCLKSDKSQSNVYHQSLFGSCQYSTISNITIKGDLYYQEDGDYLSSILGNFYECNLNSIQLDFSLIAEANIYYNLYSFSCDGHSRITNCLFNLKIDDFVPTISFFPYYFVNEKTIIRDFFIQCDILNDNDFYLNLSRSNHNSLNLENQIMKINLNGSLYVIQDEQILLTNDDVNIYKNNRILELGE